MLENPLFVDGGARPSFNGQFHHVGLAVESIEQSSDFFNLLGFVAEAPVVCDAEIDVSVQFLNHGNFRIELVEPISHSSPVLAWLKSGSPIYHLGFEVKDMQTSLNELKQQGFRKIFGPVGAVAFDGRTVCFVMNSKRLMIELISQN